MDKNIAIKMLASLTENQYRDILNDFWCYYMQNGYGSKSKSEIDTKIYDILCKFNIIDDLKPAMLIGRKLETSETNIKKYKRDRFYKHLINDDELKEQIKQIMMSNNTNANQDKIVFTINNSSAKWYLETILKEANVNYDYSFNTDNISMKVNVFIFIYGFIGGDITKLLNAIEKNKKVINSSKNKDIEEAINKIKSTNINLTINPSINFYLFGNLVEILPNISADILGYARKLFLKK